MSTPLPAPSPVSVPPDERDRWFAERVQPHESALRTWLRARFPSLTDVDDIVQESLVRVWKSPKANAELQDPKSYLFTVARNAALDLFRRRRVVPLEPLANIRPDSVLEERPSIPDTLNCAQELALLHEAIALLPDRCRTIMTLQKIHGRTNRQIAEQLGLSVHTVNAQMVIGLMRCRDYLRERGVLRGKPPVRAPQDASA